MLVKIVIIVFVAAIVALLVSLSDDVPLTGRSRFIVLSEEDEIKAWEEKSKDVLKHFGDKIVATDDTRYKQLLIICSNLIETFDERIKHEAETKRSSDTLPNFSKDRKWRLILVDDPSSNAFVLPSGHIFVFTGALQAAEGDVDRMAGMMAHEISRVALRHGNECYTAMNLISGSFDIFRGYFFVSSTPIFGFMCFIASFVVDSMGFKAFRETIEDEADAIGFEMATRAGYDPEKVFTSWNYQENPLQGSLSPWMISTVPPISSRVEKMKTLLPAMRNLFEDAKDQNLPKKQTQVEISLL